MGTPLVNVTVTVLEHAEYGSSLTQSDGIFDLAVNGGALLTLVYTKTGYLPVQRAVSAAWQDYAWLPDGRVIGFAHDANGNLSGLTPPGRPTHAFNFTALDLPSQYAPPDVNPGNDNTQFAYNADRQLTLVTRPDGQTIGAGYDSAGRLNALTIARGMFGYVYHPTTGNLAAITAPGGINLAYSDDGLLLTNAAWSGPVAGNVGFVYDNDFRVISSTINSGNAIGLQYDGDSLPIQAGALSMTRSLQNGLLSGSGLGGITDTWSYNAFAEPTGYSAAFNATPLFSTQVVRDPLGRITLITETLGG